MKRWGISIYPEHSTAERDQAYLRMAAQHGCRRVFTCLLSVEAGPTQVKKQFAELTACAKDLGMEVIVDVAPRVFRAFGASYEDLSFFREIGVDGVRLDIGFGGLEESVMTHNPHGLKIELNMSNATKYLENILSHQPNVSRLVGCHNFYPHRYTGLSYAHFVQCSRMFKERGIRTAAFITSPNASFGPWPVTEGLCTLEMHRDLPLHVQAKHLFATGLIDDVIIGDAYATEAELRAMGRINPDLLSFTVELADEASPLERKIVLEGCHIYRGDVSEYMIRSTASRIKYKAYPFPPHRTVEIERGDLLIDNELYGQYKGELQIALKPMHNSGKTNVIGRIVPEEVFLLDYLKPWAKFTFTEKMDA
ncbi:outer surface protein [Thermoactinomyces vulgaris]|nr:outer surface protein [Thermoactinomyces vulgaris]